MFTGNELTKENDIIPQSEAIVDPLFILTVLTSLFTHSLHGVLSNVSLYDPGGHMWHEPSVALYPYP